MAFMEHEIEFGTWYEIDGPNGITAIPADIVGDIGLEPGKTVTEDDVTSDRWREIAAALSDYLEGGSDTIQEVSVREGYGARLSAPGYMDATEWSVFDTEAEAKEYLDEYYPDDDSADDDSAD